MARPVDLETAVDVLGGKIEFETGEEGREREILEHLLRTATAETAREHLRGIDFGPLVDAIDDGATVVPVSRSPRGEFLAGLPVLGESELYDEVCERLDATSDGRAGRRARARARRPLPGPRGSARRADGETIYGAIG